MLDLALQHLHAAQVTGLMVVRCDAPPSVADRRVEKRIGADPDVAAATVAIARKVRESFDPWPDAIVVNTSRPLDETVDRALASAAPALAG